MGQEQFADVVARFPRGFADASLARAQKPRPRGIAPAQEPAAAARAAVANLRAAGVDGVILGCTEVPLLLGEHAEAADLINPTQVLAEAAVKAALR